MLRDGLYIFNSVHKVMRAEKVLKDAGVDVRVVPVPRSLSSDCGLALLFPWEDRETCVQALEEAGYVPEETHRLEGDTYIRHG